MRCQSTFNFRCIYNRDFSSHIIIIFRITSSSFRRKTLVSIKPQGKGTGHHVCFEILCSCNNPIVGRPNTVVVILPFLYTRWRRSQWPRGLRYDVFARWNIGIVNSNPIQGMDICLHLLCLYGPA
jgi:hypothetical protein